MLDYMERHDVCDDNGNILYNVTTVQRMNTPTWFAASDTATVTKVPAYDTRTSTDRIDALEAQVRRQAATIAALEAYIRDHSERDDVPFTTPRMAEDAWGVG